jgi:nitroreductase
METWDAIRSRRDVREFREDPLPRELLERILEAGRRSPSSRNWQPWDFVVVTDRDALLELAKVWQGAHHVAGSAATIALVAAVPEDDRHRARLEYDLGQATLQMMVAAVDLGVGSSHSAVAHQAQAQNVLGFPDGRFCAYVIPLGYPNDRPLRPIAHPDRRVFDDVVHWGAW